MLKHGLLILAGLLMCVSVGQAQTVDELILMSEEFPPYNFSENGQLQGTSIDLMTLVLQKMNAKLTRNDIKILPWARSYKALQEEKNTVLFAITRTPARENLFKWVGPISSAKNVLIARKDKQIKITSAEDVKKYKVGVIRDDAGEQLVVNLGIGKESLDITPEALSNIRKLDRGRIDLFAYDENVTKWLMKKEGLKPDDFESVYTLAEGQHYFGFHKDTPDALIQAMQNALDELKKEGEYDQVMNKYLQ